MSLSDEDEKDGPDIPACTPLAAFLSFKQEAEKRRASQVQLETTGKVAKLCHHLDWVPHLIQEHKFSVLQIGASVSSVNHTCMCFSVLPSCQSLPWWRWCPTCWLFWSSTPISSSCSTRLISTGSSWRGIGSTTAARWRPCGRPTASASETRTASSVAWRRPSASNRHPVHWLMVREKGKASRGGGECKERVGG